MMHILTYHQKTPRKSEGREPLGHGSQVTIFSVWRGPRSPVGSGCRIASRASVLLRVGWSRRRSGWSAAAALGPACLREGGAAAARASGVRPTKPDRPRAGVGDGTALGRPGSPNEPPRVDFPGERPRRFHGTVAAVGGAERGRWRSGRQTRRRERALLVGAREGTSIWRYFEVTAFTLWNNRLLHLEL